MLHVTADELPIILPADWPDMTLGQFYKYLEARTDTEILLALSDVSLDQLRETGAYDLDDVVTRHLGYLNHLPKFLSLPVPDQLIIDGKRIKVPTEVGEQITYGQKKDLEDELGNLPDQEALPEPERIPGYILAARTFLSIYLCPLVTGQRYSKSSQAYDLIPLVEQLPVTDALPLAAFFLRNFLNPKPSGKLSFKIVGRKKTTLMSRLGRLLQTWKTTLNFSRSKPLPNFGESKR